MPPGRYVGPWNFARSATLNAAGATLQSSADGGAVLDIASGATVRIEGLQIEAPPTGFAVRVEPGGSAILGQMRIAGATGEADIFVAEGALELSDSALSGDDYGVLTQAATRVEIRSSTFTHQKRDGVALVNAGGRLRDNRFVGPFDEAAVSILHSRGTRLEHNRIESTGVIGVKLVTGEASLLGNQISGALSPGGLEGNALYVYGGTVTLDRDVLENSEGPAVSLISGKATFSHVRIDGSRVAGVSLSSGATLTALGSRISSSPVGLLIEAGSAAKAEGFTFTQVERPMLRVPR